MNPLLTNKIRKRYIFHHIKKTGMSLKKNNKTIDLNILYVPHGTEEIRHAYKSKHNLRRENQVFLLMITDGEKWHYLAVKKLSTLFKGITSKHTGDFSEADLGLLQHPRWSIL